MSLLEVSGLCVSYGRSDVLHGVGFDIDEGEIVVMLGVNGAGKTTTLRALSGLVGSRGRILFDGRPIGGFTPDGVVACGIAHVPEGRGTFADFTVRENLLLGAYFRRDRREVDRDVAAWEEFFPVLRERRHQRAGILSGGEQQMLAVARALMSRPRLLLLDEPSQGLAPLVVRDLFGRLRELNRERETTMFIVEQNARLSLNIAHRAYVLQAGEIAMSGSADAMRGDEHVRRAYLGM